MATNKQVYHLESQIGNVLVNEKFNNKQELWDTLELLPETKLEDLSNKEASNTIKKLESLVVTKK